MIDGLYWVWPNKLRTHIRFIENAVIYSKQLPKGFYAAAQKPGVPERFRYLAAVAKQRGITEISKRKDLK